MIDREEYHIPAVLAADEERKESAISTLRALKNARQVIWDLLPDGAIPDSAQVAMDDLDLMIRRVTTG